MTINDFLKHRDLPQLDDKTLAVFDEFIIGTQLNIMRQSVEETRKQVDFNIKNQLTKREQFANFAMLGMLSAGDNLSTSEIKDYAYDMADSMLDGPDNGAA